MPILPTADRRARLTALAFLLLSPLAYGALGVSLGMDANWDLRNYHWYNAYAFLTGRLGTDLLPAQMPSFYNPILDLPFYTLATTLPAPAAGFVWSAIQGINLPLLFGLAMASLRGGTQMRRTLLAVALAVMGGLGGGTLGLLGTTFQDNVVSLGVLGAALVVVSGLPRLLDGPAFNRDSRPAFARVAAAGVLAGAAMGAKNPTVIFAVGLCLAFLALPARPWRRLWLAFFFGIGVLAGLAAAGGFWMAHLWEAYGNPIFPHMNHIFKSPLAAISDYRNHAFLPADPLERLFFPFHFTADPIKVGEVAWFDLRVPLLFVLVPLAGLAALWRRPDVAVGAPGAARYLLTALAVTYALWIYMFCVYRYLVPVEMLAPLAIVLAVGLLPLPVGARMGLAGALLVLVQATVRPADWGRVAWSREWVQAEVPPVAEPDRTMLLMGGYWAISHVLPLFPPQMPVVRIQSNFLQPDSVGNGMRTVLERRVAEHKGPFLMLSTIPDTPGAARAAALLGLTLDPQGCRPVPNNLGETLNLCPVRR